MASRPMKSKAKGLFSVGACVAEFEEFEKEAKRSGEKIRSSNNTTTKKTTTPKASESNLPPHLKGSSSTKIKAYLKKREDGLYNDFRKEDWLLYWQDKAYEHGVLYRIGFYPKETSIMQGLMSELSVEEIKNTIDFIWDAEHDLENKSTMGTWILSKGWIHTVFQSAQLWKEGKYMTKAEQKAKERRKPLRNREWTGEPNIDTKETVKVGKKIRL
jgi:hypothetical protein